MCIWFVSFYLLPDLLGRRSMRNIYFISLFFKFGFDTMMLCVWPSHLFIIICHIPAGWKLRIRGHVQLVDKAREPFFFATSVPSEVYAFIFFARRVQPHPSARRFTSNFCLHDNMYENGSTTIIISTTTIIRTWDRLRRTGNETICLWTGIELEPHSSI